MASSRLENIIEDLVKTAEDATKTASALSEKVIEPTIKSVLGLEILKVAAALKDAADIVSYEDLRK